MYRVYAEFDSRGAADRAADRLSGTVPGLGRIAVRPKHRHTAAADTDTYTADGALFSPNTFYQNCTFPLTAALDNLRLPAYEHTHEPNDSKEHILSAEGPHDAAEKASHLLRSYGGINITVSGSGGI